MPTQQHIDEFQLQPLRIGPEIEYPASPEPRTTFEAGGRNVRRAREWAREHFGNANTSIAGVETTFGTDGTVGAEIRPNTGNGILYRNVDEWYDELIDVMERDFGEALEPVGRMGDGGSTAGYHLHLSPLDEDTARTLWEWSQEPWMQVFVCSTLVGPDRNNTTAAVYRGEHSGYCRLNDFDSGRYNAVHRVGRGSDHYEWRLPEPMLPDHFALVMEFLQRLYFDGADEARSFAQELVANADERITAFRRAREIGIVERLGSDNPIRLTMTRTPSLENAEFFQRVRSAASAPYIYRARRHDEEFYVFVSPSGVEYTDDSSGVHVEHETVLRTDGLDEVTDDDILDDIMGQLDERRAVRPLDPSTQTDATGYLVETLLDEL
jgi:hypothetical protein